MHRAGASAISAAGVFAFSQFDSESLVHGRDRAGENHGAACGAGFLHREIVFAGKGLYARNRGGISSVTLFVFRSRQVSALADGFV
jgi:hypothetical protein